MAKWNDLPWREDVYKAAAQWRETCFFNDGSIFDHGNIWTRENFLTLKERILDKPDTRKGRKFLEKLKSQLDGAPGNSVLLMAEIMWLIYLYPLGKKHETMSPPGERRNYAIPKAESKKNGIARILSWANHNLPRSAVISPDALSGIGRTGIHPYNRYVEALQYFLPVMLDWKQLPLSERLTYRGDSKSWDLAKLVDQQSKKDTPPLRHVLLFFLYPDKFERICSIHRKEEILHHLFNHVSDEEIQKFLDRGGYDSLLAVDKAVFAVRHALTNQYKNTNIDFYVSPILELWLKKPKSKSTPFSNNEALHNYIGSAGDSAIAGVANKDTETPSYDELVALEADGKQLTEGNRKLFVHYKQERAPGLRQKKITQFLQTNPELFCEICCENAAEFPEDMRKRIFEVHHIIPISQYDGSQITDMDNLAVLCANCHRAIHYRKPPPALAEFQDILEGSKGKK